MTLRKSNWIAAACMAALSCTAAVYAQDDGSVGIVRISDGKSRASVQGTSFHGHHAGIANGNTGVGCPTGNCQTGDCQQGNCYRGPCFNGYFQERYCKNSPDHGYSPPAKYPLHRRGVQYDNLFPNQWYGTPGASYAPAPMVYQPTDTTQLGFSYQHVPFWQPAANMLPQRPIPAQWHIAAPAVHASSFHNGQGGCQYGYCCQGCYGGYGYGNGCYGMNGYGCPTNNCQFSTSAPTTAPATPPATNGQPTLLPGAPVEEKPGPDAAIPPTPKRFQNSADSGHIRRAGF